IEKDRALARRFQPIEVAELSIPDTIKVLRGLQPKYEEFHKVRYTNKSLRAAAELGERYLADRKLPDKAIDLVDEAGAILKLRGGKQPRTVLLLDEIEKAHPDLFNILLQVMDHGSLTDNNGRQSDFRHVILIMTSNVGARDLSKRMPGFGQAERFGDSDEAFKRMFSPE